MEKKDTLYFLMKVDMGNLSPEKVREGVVAVTNMVNSKQRPDDQYFEKWFILPVRDEGTSIELIYPPTDTAREQMQLRYDQFMDDLESMLSNRDEEEVYMDKEELEGLVESYEKSAWPFISREELKRRYLAQVDQIATDIDWKTQFGPEEICDIIYDIIDSEAETFGSNFYPVIYCGVKNSNGRIYENEEVSKHIEDLNKMCEAGKFVGQIGYPINELSNQLEDISLSNASHVVRGFSMDAGILWASIEVLDTPQGKLLQGLLDRKLVVFRPVVEGSVETLGETDYARINKFIGVHAINASEDSYNNV